MHKKLYKMILDDSDNMIKSIVIIKIRRNHHAMHVILIHGLNHIDFCV